MLILGGGDGALLYELQQEKLAPPKFVTMVDIDEAVLRGCRQAYQPTVKGFIQKRSQRSSLLFVGQTLFNSLLR